MKDDLWSVKQALTRQGVYGQFTRVVLFRPPKRRWRIECFVRTQDEADRKADALAARGYAVAVEPLTQEANDNDHNDTD